tara:strand:+ start:48564 stop:49607 length:1044 start_codon:yes stop_codon:yes gene_type:complete
MNTQKLNNNIFLVTGAAGFIGAAITHRLLENGESVVGIDNINEYYDKKLKYSRLEEINKKAKQIKAKWIFLKVDISDFKELNKIFEMYLPKVVINLAAQAGVRYSIQNPSAYITSNILGFGNILELCRQYEVSNLVYASSSSVYGSNKKIPYNEDNSVDHPISLYASTKKSNEVMAHSYSHLFNLPTTGLRYFTVYGPWGRPDMAPMIFTKSILSNEPIKIFNNGEMLRDFTFIEDVVECTVRCSYKPATKDDDFDGINPNPSTSFAPYRIFNIGNNKPINLLRFVNIIENKLGVKAVKEFYPHQLGDAKRTFADTSKIKKWINYKPQIELENGIDKFISWYKSYYK